MLIFVKIFNELIKRREGNGWVISRVGMLFGGRQRVETIEKVEMEKEGRRDRSCWKIRKSHGKLCVSDTRSKFLLNLQYVSIFKINVAIPRYIYCKLN